MVLNSKNPASIKNIWVFAFGVFLLLLGSFLFLEEVLHITMGLFWSFTPLPFIAGALHIAFRFDVSKGCWQILSFIPLMMASFILSLALFQFHLDFASLWLVYIILGAVPVLFAWKQRHV